jgi:hypothetical protein
MDWHSEINKRDGIMLKRRTRKRFMQFDGFCQRKNDVMGQECLASTRVVTTNWKHISIESKFRDRIYVFENRALQHKTDKLYPLLSITRTFKKIPNISISVYTLTYGRETCECGGKFPYLRHEGIKVKVKFTLEQATKAQRGSRDIALLFLKPRR